MWCDDYQLYLSKQFGFTVAFWIRHTKTQLEFASLHAWTLMVRNKQTEYSQTLLVFFTLFKFQLSNIWKRVMHNKRGME